MKFTVAVPAYTPRSGGHWYCHFLAHTLNEIGHTATIHLYEPPFRINYDWNTPVGYDPESIVIYPEGVRNDPLNAKRKVRYLLTRENMFTKDPLQWSPTDFPLSFSKAFRSDCDVLFRPNSNLEIFNNTEQTRLFNAFYVGKGSRFGTCNVLPDCVEIMRDYPSTQEELAKVLNKTRIFFSYDEVSATNVDAALCGAMPYFMTKHFEWVQENELGKHWIYSLDPEEVALAKENIRTLRPRIMQMQKEYPTKLADICNKIEAHFKNVG